jgi:nitroreductase
MDSYEAIKKRRDVRVIILKISLIPDHILAKILLAAHHTPPIGFSRPWTS